MGKSCEQSGILGASFFGNPGQSVIFGIQSFLWQKEPEIKLLKPR